MIIFGCTPYSKLLRYIMEHEARIRTTAYCLTEQYMDQQEFDGHTVVPFERLDEIYGKNNFQVLITVGYRGMNVGREKIFHQCETLGYEIASFIHPDVKIDAEQIGRGNIIMEDSRIYPFCRIGDGNILNGTVFGHESTMGNFNFMSRCTTGGLAHIGNNCFIGIGACISDSVSVGDYCLIGAGTVISKSVGNNMLVTSPKVRTMRGDPEIIGSLFK